VKWYFALSEASIDRVDHGWRGLIRVAVQSARQNTSLEPFMLYDGNENEFLDELRRMGVTVIHRRVSFYDALVEIGETRPGYLPIATGAFLRVDLPLVENTDEFVLYTDCDVTFLRDPDLTQIRPTYFAAAPQASLTDYENDMNTGVIVMNVPAMRAMRSSFVEFIISNLRAGWPGFDQENYRRHYKGKWDHLPLELNWKPYWGPGTDVGIVHWHGPKPELAQKLIADPELNTVPIWKTLFQRSPDGYRYFLDIWDKFAANLPRVLIGHMDLLSPQSVAGWILDKEDPSRPVSFHVLLDGAEIGSGTNENYRSDLERLYAAKIGGFSFSIPTQYSTGSARRLQLIDFAGIPISLKHHGVMRNTHTI
jgi:hypothetical protein